MTRHNQAMLIGDHVVSAYRGRELYSVWTRDGHAGPRDRDAYGYCWRQAGQQPCAARLAVTRSGENTRFLLTASLCR
jgi:hypothetical protein